MLLDSKFLSLDMTKRAVRLRTFSISSLRLCALEQSYKAQAEVNRHLDFPVTTTQDDRLRLGLGGRPGRLLAQ